MKKLLVSTAIIVALSLSGCSEQKTFEELISSAQKASSQGEYATAVIDYKNAVRLSPKNADARLGLGQAYLRQGAYVSAEKELDKADELGAKFNETVLLQAQVKTHLNNFSAVEGIVKRSGELDDNSYIVVLSYAGISALSSGEVTKAQDYFSQAASFASNDFSTLSKAYILYLDKEIPQALTTLETILSNNPDFSEALLLKGHLKASLKNYEEASHAFKAYLNLYPQDTVMQFAHVDSIIKAEKYEEARILTNDLLKRFKDSPLAYQFKAQIDFHDEKYIEARQHANQAINLKENSPVAKIVAGISSYKLNELEQAYDYLVSVEKLLPANHPVNVILLSIKIKLGLTDDLSTSVARLELLQSSDKNSDLLQLTSFELERIGDYSGAETLLTKAEEFSPNDATIKARKGALLLSQGDLSGVKSLEEAVSIDPSFHEAEFALAIEYIKADEINKARAIATKWLATEETEVLGNILSGLISVKLEHTAEAELYFNKALAKEPNNITALYNIAVISAFKYETELALEKFEKVIRLNPNHNNAIKRYSLIKISEGKIAESISFLGSVYDESKLRNSGIPKNLVISLAQNMRVNRQTNESIKLLETIRDEPNLPARYWYVFADSYQVAENFDEALNLYEEGFKRHPNNFRVRLGYIGLLEKLKYYSKALVLTRQANKHFPNNETLMTSLAYLELANNNVQEAKKQIQLLDAQGVTNSLVVETKASLAIKDKDYKQAVRLYRYLYNEKKNSDNAINLARSLQFSKQPNKAEEVLELFLEQNNTDINVRVILAELYIENNIDGKNTKKIIAIYRGLINTQPNNIVALNNLAWHEYKIKAHSDALLHIEQAIKIKPNDRTLQETYGVILQASKQFDKSIEVLSEVMEKGSVDINAKVSLAEAYIATKQKQKAKLLLEGLSSHDSELNSKIVKLKASL